MASCPLRRNRSILGPILGPLSLCPCFRLSVHLSVWSASFSICLSSSVCPFVSVRPSVCLPVSLFVCRPACLSICLSVPPSVRFLTARSFFLSLPCTGYSHNALTLSFCLDFLFSSLSLPWWHSPRLASKEHHPT